MRVYCAGGMAANWSITVENIDWSEIIEDAEFAGSISGEQLPVFYKNVTSSSYEYHYPCAAGWSGKIIGQPACIPLIPRPSLQWSGQGLPPAMTVCEMHHESWNANNWPKVTVKYASAEYFITEDGAGEQHWHAQSVTFRPIRTPEQIAKDEREASIGAMLKSLEFGLITTAERIICAKLYDAGYRKP